ncbi:MAG: DNA repair protein RecN, partial [Verrucomicrobiota bacterium]
LERTDATAKPLMEQLEQVSSFLQDLQRDLTHYSERLELDPDRLQELETRLNLLRSLQRKYGPGISEILAFGAEARRKLESLEQRDAELARLNGQLQTLDRQILEAGQELTARRRKLIPRLSKAVAQQLGDLGFKQSQFEILLQSQSEAEAWPDLNATGFDSIEFLFAPNPGEPARPLRAIASSGEMARVMLALKTVLAAEDEIPVLVFDEVDANVGGETARAVGEKMVQIARNRQVLCITHLAPVAAQALTHFVVSKNTSEGRTLSTICRLEEESDRITELARMLGGQSHAARQHAADLLKSSAGHNSSSRAA